jgi:manganese transport protein
MTAPSLPEVHQSIPIPKASVGRLRRFFAFAGPGFLISVGYMDPGNWSTDLAGGSTFGYALLWVVLASNLMAIVLQTLCARLGLVTGKDLAQACREYYPKPVALVLYGLCEIAIIACDLAEVIGSAVALKLLFNIPIIVGVLITGFDVLLLLALTKRGFRWLEAIILTLVITVAGCFFLQIALARPDWAVAGKSLLTPQIPGGGGLFLALGILGATVMPHNLYLHSSIVQTRRILSRSESDVRQAIRYNTLDTVLALSLAFFVNAAILVLAASVFFPSGHVVEKLEEAHRLLTPLLGGGAAVAFAVALLASGQSSTLTGTLAGQIVMEGFLQLKINPAKRRLITRLLALIPAIVLIWLRGESKTVELLNWSQVVLSLQLSFAVFPLLAFTSSKKQMGVFASPLWLQVLGYGIGLVIAMLNARYLWETIGPLWFGVITLLGMGFAAWVKFAYRAAK